MCVNECLKNVCAFWGLSNQAMVKRCCGFIFMPKNVAFGPVLRRQAILMKAHGWPKIPKTKTKTRPRQPIVLGNTHTTTMRVTGSQMLSSRHVNSILSRVFPLKAALFLTITSHLMQIIGIPCFTPSFCRPTIRGSHLLPQTSPPGTHFLTHTHHSTDDGIPLLYMPAGTCFQGQATHAHRWQPSTTANDACTFFYFYFLFAHVVSVQTKTPPLALLLLCTLNIKHHTTPHAHPPPHPNIYIHTYRTFPHPPWTPKTSNSSFSSALRNSCNGCPFL